MKLGIILYSNDSETVWNAFRLGVFARSQGDTVKVFLLGKGVECESLDTEVFRINEQIHELLDAGGEILACGTCLEIRNSAGTEVCPVSTLQDLHTIITESDRVVTF